MLKKNLFMKQLHHILLPLLLLAGCNNDTTLDTAMDATATPVVVRVSPLSPYNEPATRAPIEGWNNVRVLIAYGESSGGVFSSYTEVKNGLVHGITSSFIPPLFYPSGNKYIHMRGFFPEAGIVAGMNLATGELDPGQKITYKITGQEDIMISTTVSGSEVYPIASTTEMNYRHLLTQIRFTLINDGTFPISKRVKQIRIENVRTDAELDLLAVTDHLTFSGPPTQTLNAYTGDFTIPVNTPSPTMGRVMIQPGASFRVKVIFSDNTQKDVLYESPTVMDTGGTAGTAHSIYVKFSAKGLIPTIAAEDRTEINSSGTTGWTPEENFW
jgi:hypothetical protein